LVPPSRFPCCYDAAKAAAFGVEGSQLGAVGPQEDGRSLVLAFRQGIGSLLIALSLALASCVADGPGGAPDPDRNADKAAIHALLSELEAAANARDPGRTAAAYTPDGDIWVAGGPWVSGSAEIRQFEAEFYRAPGYRRWDLTIDEIRFLAPNAVLVEISSTTTIDGGGLSDRMTLVVVRQGAEWKIAAVRIMNVEEQPP
jgi:uncharacterized protein (TIGR02246 family)